ncbi:MAG TPA: DUF1858 domain-containing protein [Candidatus Obscuribacterales bacterium]
MNYSSKVNQSISGGDQSIAGSTMIPDLLARYPSVKEVLDRYGLKGCGGPLGPHESLEYFARAHDVPLETFLKEITAASAKSNGAAQMNAAVPGAADTIYRRFFLGGIIVALTAGATWGAHLLLKIATHHSFAAVARSHIESHAHAQVFGWMGLFIMGFAYQAFPRFWHTELAHPRLAVASFVLMVSGIILSSYALAAGPGHVGVSSLALSGGAMEFLAVSIFVLELISTYWRGKKSFEPYIAYVIVALFWFVFMSAVSFVRTFFITAEHLTEGELPILAAWSSSLRDMQFHGLALTIILGVSQRTLPHLFGLARIKDATAYLSLFLLTCGVLIEVFSAPVAAAMGVAVNGFLVYGAWSLIAAGAAVLLLSWKLWRPFPEPDRSIKFIRFAYLWLAVSLIMLLMTPLHQAISGLSNSHAYFGAIRHALTVGFISLMIMGYAARVVPTLNGIDRNQISQLWGPFFLLNTGCMLRVILQTLTDFSSVPFSVLGVSGVLEVTGLAWWGIHIARLIFQGKQSEKLAYVGLCQATKPEAVTGDAMVFDTIACFPETVPVFLQYGFRAVTNPFLLKTMARQVTLSQACRMHAVDESKFLADLNRVLEEKREEKAEPEKNAPLKCEHGKSCREGEEDNAC